MDRVFTEVAATFKTVVSLTHQQRVTRLYRRSLRELNSWVIDRELFCEEAEKIRAQFNENRALDPHSGLSQRLIREAESKVFSFTHPDPYVKPYMPGGSKFMRNPPIPLKVRPACLRGLTSKARLLTRCPCPSRPSFRTAFPPSTTSPPKMCMASRYAWVLQSARACGCVLSVLVGVLCYSRLGCFCTHAWGGVSCAGSLIPVAS